MSVSANDISILRSLAQRYMEYALSPKNEEKRRMWTAHNMHRGCRPLITIDQLPWDEMNDDGSLSLKVEDPYFRGIEWTLRSEMYKWERLPADMVLNPYILLPRPISNTGYGVQAQVERIGYSQRFTNQFNEPEDIEKIKTPQISLNIEAEKSIKNTAEMIFDGIAPCRMQGMILHCGLWDQVSFWMGVENCYIELLDRPEFIHALMERLTGATIGMIEQIDKLGLYDVNTNICHCSYTFDDRLPSDDCDRDNPKPSDGWAFGMAQLFSSVSPAITAEFEIPYMQRIFSHFGSIYYGCCDRLDDRLDLVEKLHNVRKVSCSPWSDRDAFAEKLDHKYIMSAKPSPAYLARDEFNEEECRADLRRTIDAARRNGQVLELLLKDVSTIRGDVSRLTRWSEIAIEECER